MRSSKASGVSWSSRRALRFVPAAATSACSGPSAARRAGERGDRRAIGDVEAVGDDVAPGGRLLDELGAARRRMHVRAGVGEGQRGGEADPARGAGDQRGAAVERAPRSGLPAGAGEEDLDRRRAAAPRRGARTRRARPRAGAPRPARPATRARRPATRAPARSRPSCRRRSRAARAGRARCRGSRASCRRRRGRCRPPARRGAGARAPSPASPARRRRRGRGRRRAPRSRRARRRAPRRASPKASCAPSASARSRRCAWGSRTATCAMPDSSAACSVTSPIVPAPSTTARADRVAGQPEAHRVHAVGQRLDQRADARRDAVGQRARVGRRRGHEVGEGAVVVDADQRAPRAQVLLAGARTAGSARSPPSGLTATRAPSHAPAPAPAATTTPANSWPITSGGVRLPMWPEVALDLRAADADRLGAQDQLAGAGVVAARGAPRSPSAPGRARRSPSSSAASHARACQ